MRSRKIFAIAFLLITGPVILESCCLGGGSCGCGLNGDPPRYDINGMSLALLPYPNTSTTVPSPAVFSAVEFAVNMEVTYVELMGSFGSALFACSPLPPEANQPIEAISITSNAVMETTTGNAPAGSNLNFIFKTHHMGYYGRPVEDLIGEPYLDRTFTFRSEAALNKLQTHTFTIVIKLTDGREFTLVTPSLELE